MGSAVCGFAYSWDIYCWQYVVIFTFRAIGSPLRLPTMKLRKLKVRNFRCYKNEILLDFDDLTTLVGRNDSGKSSLMDALDTFFNDRSLDKNDASKGGNAKDVAITCVFGELPGSMIIDDKAESSLESEYLLNADGELEVEKVYNCSVDKPKVTEINLKVRHPTVPLASDLLALKIDQLKERAKEVGANLSSVDQKVKPQLRAAIRDALGQLELSHRKLVLVVEPSDKNNGEMVWSGIKNVLPTFALFKSDRQSSDQDSEAQDPMKIAVKEAIAGKLAELDVIFGYVESEVKKVADLTLLKLREMDAAIASTLTPKFEKPDWAKQFKASITGDNDIPLNKRGSGVRRMVLLNFFRAKAERQSNERLCPTTIYAVEEPETSQHPHNQRLLMRALQSLSGDDQVIVTTHTPMLARSIASSALRFVSPRQDGTREIQVGGTDDVNDAIARSLGVLPDHSVKLFIAVEGIHDISFLKNLAAALRKDGLVVPDLDGLEMAG